MLLKMTMNKFPDQPRYTFAKKKAIDIIITSRFCILPVSPAGLIMQHYGKKVKLYRYSDLAKKANKPIDYVCKYLKTDDGMVSYAGEGRYIIFYNDTMYPEARITFTLAHEFAHIVLEHHHFDGIDPMNLTDEQHKLLEQEANAFATELLAPTSIAKLLWESNVIRNQETMQKYFNLSKKCAKYAYRSLITFRNTEIRRYKQKEIFYKLCSKPHVDERKKTTLRQ